MEALVKAESGAGRVVVFDHAADDAAREARKIPDLSVSDGRSFLDHVRGWIYYQRLARGRR